MQYKDGTSPRRKDNWTAEQDETIVAMRNERYPWKDIGERLGRTIESCCARYRVIVPPGRRARFVSSRQWSVEEEQTLKQMMAEGRKPRAIAKVLGKDTKSIYSKIQQLRQPGRPVHIEMQPRVRVPPDRAAERDRRMAAERDITAEFFGDPPKGFSALDKKQGVFA